MKGLVITAPSGVRVFALGLSVMWSVESNL